MTLIWKQGYTTGVEKLDDQHRHIFELLNTLEDLVDRRTSQDAPLLDHLEAIEAHVKQHFGDEECCMRKAHCPMAEKNRQEHAYFLEHFAKHMARYRKEPSLKIARELHRFAESWLHEHVAFLDIHLREYAESV